jgi:hypothetical protein
MEVFTLKHEISLIMYENSDSTSQRIEYLSVTKANLLIVYGETGAFKDYT